ncbi:MAG: hypothetical protein JNL64_04685 [Blastocatellia bacterium]|nr:hypothetical protein [Blastocatellia bacterium]
MTERKHNNSILVLATLGVYLGLVLAGATPQILAQAATTRLFDVKDEIEVKEDLDNKPDDCELLRDGVRKLEVDKLWFNHSDIGAYSALVEDLIEVYSEGNYDSLDVNWVVSDDARPFSNILSRSNLARPQLSKVDFRTRDIIERDILELANGFPGLGIEFSLVRNDIDTVWKLNVKNNGIDADKLHAAYNSSLYLYRCARSLDRRELLLKHTSVSVEDTNLVVITRLPRGSLDSLLAKDAK